MAEYHEVYCDAQWPDICLICVFVLAQDLRGHELERARECRSLLVEIVLIYHLSHSKIRYFYVALMQQDIFGFDVAMDYFLILHVL